MAVCYIEEYLVGYEPKENTYTVIANTELCVYLLCAQTSTLPYLCA